MLNGLDLFSGIGGIGIALKDSVRTVAYCEQDRYCQSVLLSRMWEGDIDRAPIWDDVRTLKADMLPEIDIIFGGFPCQDLSVAGKGKGLEGERSGLFFEIIRLTKEIRPSFVFLENVPAIRTRGLEQVIKAFAEVGYDCRWTCLTASSVGAPHKRERWFLLAHANGERGWIQQIGTERQSKANADNNGTKESLAYSDRIGLSQERTSIKTAGIARDRDENGGEDVADSLCKGLERQRQESKRVKQKYSDTLDESWWALEPNVGRVVNGIPYRTHRIKALGNSVVPAQVKKAFEVLIGEHREK